MPNSIPTPSPDFYDVEEDDNVHLGIFNSDDDGVRSGEFDEISTISPNNENNEIVVVKGEEVAIVIIVLLLWIGAIALFFNRWGKIRMLEPYQPKFCETHRPSCPIADVATLQHFQRSYSKFNLSMSGDPPHFAKCSYHGISPNTGVPPGTFLTTSAILSSNRPRQNSVFVTSPHSSASAHSNKYKNASRKTKSAIDLSSLVLTEEFFESVRRNSKNSVTHV